MLTDPLQKCSSVYHFGGFTGFTKAAFTASVSLLREQRTLARSSGGMALARPMPANAIRVCPLARRVFNFFRPQLANLPSNSKVVQELDGLAGNEGQIPAC